ncbi:MAG: cell division protein FtsA [Patescibacteria group bacterium]
MARHTSVGIDIGSHHIKAVIAEEAKEGERIIPKILGTGFAETRGLRKGFIVDVGEVSRSVRTALDKAEKAAGVEVKRAFVSVGGIGLGSTLAIGSVAVSRADLEVTNLDIENAHEAAEAVIPQALSLNRKIINTIPVEVKLDGKTVLSRLEGMRGSKLDVRILFVTCLEHHLEDLIRAVEGAGVEVVDVVAAPVAASFVILSKKQKRAGCLLVNIGAETTSLVVFENSNPLSLEVLEIGGGDVTNDIALGLKTTLEEAESIKLGSLTRTDYPKKKLDDIIGNRLSEMMGLIDQHLKKIGRHQLLPAGVILTGGGSALYGLREFVEDELKLPARIGSIHFGDDEKISNKDLPWSTAYGLAIFGFNADNEQGSVGQHGVERVVKGGRKGFLTLSRWISKFLP